MVTERRTMPIGVDDFREIVTKNIALLIRLGLSKKFWTAIAR